MAAELTLLQPLWLLALPLPLLACLWIIRRSASPLQIQTIDSGDCLSVRHPFTALLYRQTNGYQQTTDQKQHRGLAVLYCLTAMLLLFALSQPVRYGAATLAQPEPVDLTLIIDTSVSMFLKDYEIQGQAIDRMTMTQSLLDRFAARFNGRRLGIIVFGDTAYHWLKPSEDRKLVRHLLSRLQTSMAGRQSAIGDALSAASKSLAASDTTQTLDENKGGNKKVAVLITDAVRPGGQLSPQQGARLAANAGMTVYTIAIGATGQDRDRENFAQLLYEPANITLLDEIANISGGKNFHATDAAAMDQALRQIEAKHRSTTDHAASRLQQPLYIWPLALAILLLVWINLQPMLRGRS